MLYGVLAGVLAAGLPAARGDEDASPATVAELQRRVEQLDGIVRQMQSERLGAAPTPSNNGADSPPPSDTGGVRATPVSSTTMDQPAVNYVYPGVPLLAGWNEGFFVQNADKSFMLRITGQLQADYRAYVDRPDTTDIDTFLIRRARLGIEATMFDYYEFRLLPDFAGSSAGTQITDAYMNVHYVDEFQFEAGKFKQPLSYEQLIQDRYVPFMERSMIDQLVPARDVGVMIHGRKLFEDQLDYAVALSDGEINGNGSNGIDTNNGKDLNARVVFRPFNTPDGGFLRHLQFGMSGGWGVENEALNTTTNPITYKTPATVPWFSYNAGVTADGLRTRLSPELSYFYRSFGFAAQYYQEEQKLSPSAASPIIENVQINGFYVMGSYLLTGEQRSDYSEQIAPLRNFDPHCPCCCPGAWEVLYRVSRLEVDNNVFQAGAGNLANATKYSPGATESTLGINWYLNKWVRTQFNWEHAWFDNPVALGTAPNINAKDQDTLYVRLQFIF
jgi:phosphate-selective porin OprO/OprP